MAIRVTGRRTNYLTIQLSEDIIALGLAKRDHEERYFKQFTLLLVIIIFSPSSDPRVFRD